VKLLLVEDDRIVRITVRDALADDGYVVTDCADGTAALQALERETFDVVLTDVRLPGVDGLTVFRTARRASPRAAVVLMTAYADAEVGLLRFGGQFDYAANLNRAALSNSAGPCRRARRGGHQGENETS
jgi:two-component system, NtrC family, response regulator AtoC